MLELGLAKPQAILHLRLPTATSMNSAFRVARVPGFLL